MLFLVQFHIVAHCTQESVDEDFCFDIHKIDSSWSGDAVLKSDISLSHIMRNKTIQNETISLNKMQTKNMKCDYQHLISKSNYSIQIVSYTKNESNFQLKDSNARKITETFAWTPQPFKSTQHNDVSLHRWIKFVVRFVWFHIDFFIPSKKQKCEHTRCIQPMRNEEVRLTRASIRCVDELVKFLKHFLTNGRTSEFLFVCLRIGIVLHKLSN